MALKEEKVSVTSGKKKGSVRKETDAVSVTKPKIVRKNQNTLPPHLLSIRPSANSLKNETGCMSGDTCPFPHYKVDEQPNKKPKKSYFLKRRESDDKNALAIVKSVSQLGVVCVSQDLDALVSQGRKSRGNPMQKVLEPTQRVRFTKSTLRHASIREKKGPSSLTLFHCG